MAARARRTRARLKTRNLEQGALGVNCHPRLDPGSIFSDRSYLIAEQVDAMIGSSMTCPGDRSSQSSSPA